MEFRKLPTNIVYKQGDLLESKMQTLTNAVNTVGIMSKGIAKEFKKKYPEMFQDYYLKCKNGLIRVGEPYVWIPKLVNGKWILNFPTKEHWRGKSKIEWVEQGLFSLQKNYGFWGIQSLAVPALGAGLGGLNWQDVKRLLENYLGKISIPVEIYEPVSQKNIVNRKS
jgi:O-acetyl-ADP-ribose deacetylase (regulator of RNase III)